MYSVTIKADTPEKLRVKMFEMLNQKPTTESATTTTALKKRGRPAKKAAEKNQMDLFEESTTTEDSETIEKTKESSRETSNEVQTTQSFDPETEATVDQANRALMLLNSNKGFPAVKTIFVMHNMGRASDLQKFTPVQLSNFIKDCNKRLAQTN